MTPHIQRAELPPNAAEELPQTDSSADDGPLELGFEQIQWSEPQAEREARSISGRDVLGWALVALAILWMGYTAWSAGRVLADQPLSSPAIAQWLSIAAAPLALLALAWIMFGRTRRREAERFTRSVIAMRAETQSLEALLEVLSQRIEDSQASLTGMTERLMRLGDETTGRFEGISRELDTSSERLSRSGAAADRAAEAARNDIAVLLEDLPKAEATTRAIAEQLRGIGSDSASRTSDLGKQVGALSERTREADELVAAASQRLVTHPTRLKAPAPPPPPGSARRNPRSRWLWTRCSTGPPGRSTKFAAGSTPRPRQSRRLSSKPRRGSAAPESKRRTHSARRSARPRLRSTGCRRGSRSRSACRSGCSPKSIAG